MSDPARRPAANRQAPAVARRSASRRPAGPQSGRATARSPRGSRYAVVYDIDGPRVRLGVLWFAMNVAALVLGRPALAALYASIAAVAALQTAKVWSAKGRRADRGVAAVGAAALPAAAAVSSGLFGLAILALVAGAFATSRLRPGQPAAVAATLQCSLFAGSAAACLVITDRYEIGAAWALVLAVAAYETGDYIVGSGARNPYEGPLAGAVAILVVAFTVSVLGVPPFDFPAGFVFGALAAVLCPIGQLVGSAVLPSAGARAPALRRLDSLLVLAPMWAFAIGLYIQSLK